jgi:hypothetical protein
MKKLLLLIGLLYAGSSFAQVTQTNYQMSSYIEFFRGYKVATGEVQNTLSEKDIKGSPYLNSDFIKGSLFTNNAVEYTDIPLRYNIYNDEMEFVSPEQKTLAMTTPEILDKVTFGDYTMEYLPYDINGKVKHGFFIVISKGNASLYARPEVLFQQAVPPGAYKEPEPAKFIRKADSYFIRIGQEAALKVDNKKELLAAFTDHQGEIETFIKKNKIGTKDAADLKKLVEYYNSL